MSNSAIAVIGETKISILFFNAQPVITLAMMDQVHGRPEGTASRNFREHKAKLIEGEDYFLVKANQKDEIRPLEIDIPNRGLIILTETGYLLLVKSFTDDLAWQVQRQLVKAYFKAKTEAALLPTLSAPRAKKQIKGGLELHQQDAINDFIKQRLQSVPQEKRGGMATRIYSAICTKFGTKGMKDGYKNIAPEHFDNIMQLIARLPLDEDQLILVTAQELDTLVDQRVKAKEGELLPPTDAAPTQYAGGGIRIEGNKVWMTFCIDKNELLFNLKQTGLPIADGDEHIILKKSEIIKRLTQ